MKVIPYSLITIGILCIIKGMLSVVAGNFQIDEIKVLIIGSISVIISLFLLFKQRNENQYISLLKINDYKISGITEYFENLTEKKKKSIGAILYKELLLHYIEDFILSDSEKDELKYLQNYFNVSDEIIKKIKKSISKKSIEKFSELIYSDKIITPEEERQIFNLGSELEISYDYIKNINKNNALKILRQEIKELTIDHRLTKEDELQLALTLEKLGFSKEELKSSLSESDKRNLAYYKLLAEIEDGNLPVISTNIPLQKNEICHISTDANRLETKIVTVGHSGGSRGVSIRIAKGLTYRVGSYKGGPIKEEVTFKFPGKLIVTSKRIIFIAAQKGFSIPLSKVTNLEPYDDGIGIQKDSTHYLLSIDEKITELLCLIITTAINKL
ncbi:hypothetical protein P3G55_17670 [Leptospira sp. 96542]|nr:hypothetical protein [Leptospira sp. 96542]